MRARYNRISTASQNLERQLAKQNPDEKLYNDVVSGSIAFSRREKGSELLKDVKEGTISYVVVAAIDRLGRNLHDVIGTLQYFQDNNVVVRVDNLGLESMVEGKINPTFNLIVSVMASVATMEREALLERQQEGIAIAKAKKIYKGRVKGSIESPDEVLAKYRDVIKYLNKGQSLRDTAKLAKVALGTVQKVKLLLKQKHEELQG